MRSHFRDGLVRPLILAALAGAATGCFNPVPYQPNRAVVRGIPAEAAKSELRRVLGVAYTWQHGEDFDVGDVGDASFALRERSGGTVHVFRYAELAPTACRIDGSMTDAYFIRFQGEIGAFDGATLENGIIMIDRKDDVEVLFDALESLKADALARPRGATP